jgi:hypothetical protein
MTVPVECVNYVTFLKIYVTLPAGKLITFNLHFKKSAMSLLTVLIVLIIAGVILWLINSYIPMQRTIKNILNIVVIIIVIVWLLKAFGVFHYVTDIHI